MGLTTEELKELRTPPEIKAGDEDDYHEHITKGILGPLDRLSSKDLSSCAAKSGEDALDELDPSLDTLPYLYILCLRIAAAKRAAKTPIPESLTPDDGALYQKLVMFLVSLDPIEIRYAGAKWTRLVELLASIAEEYPEQDAVLGDMAAAMLTLDPSVGTLTSTHLVFVHTCLTTEAYAQAHHILQKDIHSFAGKSTTTTDGEYPCADHTFSSGFIDTKESSFTDNLSLADILEYYLLGAMCYIGARRWANAIYYLEHVLCAPTDNIACGIMIEAYQKWVLANLLLKGDVPLLPKAANVPALRLVRNTSKAYESLVDAFKLPDPRKLAAEVDLGEEIWEEDGNHGLVQRVLQHHRTMAVMKLGKVFAALPLSKAATYQGLSVEQVEEYLQSLIRDGVLNAVIDAPSEPSGEAILRFTQKPAAKDGASSETDLCDDINAQTRRIRTLTRHVEEANRRLSLTKEYIEHARRARRSKEERDGEEDESLMDFPMYANSSSDDEESIMTDA